MKSHYDILIVGATLEAARLAHGNCGKSIAVIEQGCVCAPEYALALHPTKISEFDIGTVFNKRVVSELTSRKAVDADGNVWTPALGPITAMLFIESEADVYFNSTLTKLESFGDKYTAEFFSWGITSHVTASAIIDTTALVLTRAYFNQPSPKLTSRLNYLVSVNGKPELRSAECPDDDIAKARKLILESEKDKIILIAHETDRSPFSEFVSDRCTARTPKPIYSGEYDIIIAGLGTAGAIAAIAAARMGLRVLGLENLRLQGGSGTASSVLGSYYGIKGGEYIATDKSAHEFDSRFVATWGIGAGQKMLEFDRQSTDEAVEVRYGCQVTDVLRDGNRIIGAVWNDDGIPCMARARFVIDCTAESSVCIAAGCDMLGGRSSDGTMQPFSNCVLRTNGENVGMSYTDNGVVDQYNPDDFSRNVLVSSVSYSHLRSDYSNKNYLGVAPLLGMREGRKIVGEETVAFADLIAGNFSREPLYYGYSNLDNHGKDSIFEERIYQDFITICGLWGYGFSIPIPTGALIPKGFDGLLAAGRNVSVDHTLAMGLRMKDDCQKSGESAAKLAALAIRHGVSAREVDYSELSELLRKSGCLGETDRMLLERQQSDEVHELPFWCFDEKELADGLASDSPGYYMWSAKSVEATALLERLLDSAIPQTRWHAALAMSLLSEFQSAEQRSRLIKILAECASSRDAYVPKSGRRHINLRAISAVCALGRIGDESALSKLYDILDRDYELDNFEFVESDLIMDREDLKFQFRSHLISAICEISSRCGDATKAAAKNRLFQFIAGKSFTTSIFATNKIRTDLTDSIRQLVENI